MKNAVTRRVLQKGEEAGAALALLLTLGGIVFAQSSSGTITGRVVDSADQPVPGATATLIKEDTGETRQFTSDEAGEFAFAAIQPGTYDLVVKLEGFKQYEQRGLSL